MGLTLKEKYQIGLHSSTSSSPYYSSRYYFKEEWNLVNDDESLLECVYNYSLKNNCNDLLFRLYVILLNKPVFNQIDMFKNMSNEEFIMEFANSNKEGKNSVIKELLKVSDYQNVLESMKAIDPLIMDKINKLLNLSDIDIYRDRIARLLVQSEREKFKKRFSQSKLSMETILDNLYKNFNILFSQANKEDIEGISALDSDGFYEEAGGSIILTMDNASQFILNWKSGNQLTNYPYHSILYSAQKYPTLYRRLESKNGLLNYEWVVLNADGISKELIEMEEDSGALNALNCCSISLLSEIKDAVSKDKNIDFKYLCYILRYSYLLECGNLSNLDIINDCYSRGISVFAELLNRYQCSYLDASLECKEVIQYLSICHSKFNKKKFNSIKNNESFLSKVKDVDMNGIIELYNYANVEFLTLEELEEVTLDDGINRLLSITYISETLAKGYRLSVNSIRYLADKIIIQRKQGSTYSDALFKHYLKQMKDKKESVQMKYLRDFVYLNSNLRKCKNTIEDDELSKLLAFIGDKFIKDILSEFQLTKASLLCFLEGHINGYLLDTPIKQSIYNIFKVNGLEIQKELIDNEDIEGVLSSENFMRILTSESLFDLSKDFIHEHRISLLEFIESGKMNMLNTYFKSHPGRSSAANARIIAKNYISGHYDEMKCSKVDLEEELNKFISDDLYLTWKQDDTFTDGNFRISDTSDFESVFTLGTIPTETCQSYINGSYNESLTSNFDASKKILRIYKGSKCVARAILRLTTVRGEGESFKFTDFSQQESQKLVKNELCIFVEKMYTPDSKGQYLPIIEEFLREKAARMNVSVIYSTRYTGLLSDSFTRKDVKVMISRSRNGQQYLDSLRGSISDSSAYSWLRTSIYQEKRD